MACVIFHEKCASFSLAMESVILQKARIGGRIRWKEERGGTLAQSMVVSGSEREYNITDSDMCGLFASGIESAKAKTTNGVKADGNGSVGPLERVRCTERHGLGVRGLFLHVVGKCERDRDGRVVIVSLNSI